MTRAWVSAVLLYCFWQFLTFGSHVKLSDHAIMLILIVLAGFAAGAAVGIIILICVFILVCDRRRRPYISSAPHPLGMVFSQAFCSRAECGV